MRKPWEHDKATKAPSEASAAKQPCRSLADLETPLSPHLSRAALRPDDRCVPCQLAYGEPTGGGTRFSSARPLLRREVGLKLCDPTFRCPPHCPRVPAKNRWRGGVPLSAPNFKHYHIYFEIFKDLDNIFASVGTDAQQMP